MNKPWSEAYRAYLRNMGPDTWDAMPMWFRVRLCLECSWLDALCEVSPTVSWLVWEMRSRARQLVGR